MNAGAGRSRGHLAEPELLAGGLDILGHLGDRDSRLQRETWRREREESAMEQEAQVTDELTKCKE